MEPGSALVGGNESPYIVLWHLSITLGLGLLLGLERERAGKELGLRTFSFSALLGYLSWKMGTIFAVSTLALVAVIVIVINVRALQKGAGVEATTSVSLFLVVYVGMLVAQDQLFTAVSVVILMLMLLSWKEEMVLFSHALQRHEIHAAITLLLLTFVILPVLPNYPLDPWGLFQPQRIWFMVVLISAISFANYVLLRLYGARGVAYTGFFGGLVNSQVASFALAQQARHGPAEMEDLAFRGIMWAKTAAFLRTGIILALFAPSALPAGFFPMGLMLVVTLAYALRKGPGKQGSPPAVTVESPFSLRSALSFGLLFAIITVVGSVAQRMAGNFGFYAVSIAGGLVSSASTTATAATLVEAGQIPPLVAGGGVVLANLSSNLIVLPLVWRGSQRPRLMRRMVVATAWMVAAMVVGLLLNPLLLDQLAAVAAWLAQ